MSEKQKNNAYTTNNVYLKGMSRYFPLKKEVKLIKLPELYWCQDMTWKAAPPISV